MAGVVLFNAHAGKRQAEKRLQKLRSLLPGEIEICSTERPGHAEEMALRAASAGTSPVIAAGGDGTVHEAANGILRSGNGEVTLGVLPLGSANDYAYSLRKRAANLAFAVDVGQIREPGGKERYFVCCLGLGLNGAVTLEARRIKKLQGVFLYGWATIKALWKHYQIPQMKLTIDGQETKMPTLMASVMIGHREGGFLLAPDAVLDDGLFDFVHAGALSRWQVMKLLPRLAIWGTPKSFPKVWQGRGQSLQLESEKPLICHIDGEFFATPEENIRQVDIRVLEKRLRVQLYE
jgi:diacylglycerol kinase (ATP)